MPDISEERKPEPAIGVEINWYLTDGTKIRLVSDENGHLSGATCPACEQETISVLQVMQLRVAGLAGMMAKFGGEWGVQARCTNPDCDSPPSRVVTPKHHRSYEQPQ
jgi:hypothetical protein